MDDEEFFEGLEDQFKEMMDSEALASLEAISARWQAVGGLVADLTDGEEVDWLEEQLAEHGVNIKALLMFGLRLAVQKNVAPMDYTASFVSGYMMGYLSAKEDAGEDVIDEILSARPERDEDDIPSRKGYMQLREMPSEAGVRTLDEVGQFMRKQSRNVGRNFDDPDDDWAPMMMVVTKTATTMVGMDIPTDDEMKTVLFTRALPQTIRQSVGKPEVVGFITSAWTAEGPDAMDVRPSENPDRTEHLFLHLRDKEGTTETWCAPIFRDGEQAPALGKWKKLDGEMFEGRIVTMFDRIFR